MVKIGGVSLDTSHPKCFQESLEKLGIDMKYAYECNLGFRDKEEEQWFLNRFGVEKVSSIEEMADKVDIAFIQSCNWEKHLDQAMPFIKVGTPVFIDKPIVGSIKDVKRLRELVAKGAVVYGASAMRYIKDIQEFLARPVEDRGEVVSIFVEGGVNEFDYAIHSMEIASELAQSKAISGKYVGQAKDTSGNVCQSFFVEFENGVTATYYSYHNRWCKAMVLIMTTKGPVFMELDGFVAFDCMLNEVYQQITTGKSKLADVETLINCSLAMLCCKKSRDEKNGEKVTINDLDDSDTFDGYAFEKAYTSAQLSRDKLYKD